ncbi:S-adenosylmethionine:tRNA ribosyltransferase-isomerase [Bacillus sp. FJAT-49736]|uniref:S-adenosylmethionine:tRNA ribosyltransferase-isomerase n=1 Tax=Bacillus sp. FJAT-49736 TaxID=2833582 RepID=UPI001BC9DB87|nr:S-adenosylmethionine:tRNA ribosyltransferase-isomerase [Bacillus sp. FJAT-49736]MBS4173665.1 S-adenosylmethionine:tRNA ribosyltransferase-isomerase [Bacillus sp. FJAT-49736]
MSVAAMNFTLPEDLNAKMPPERRGVRRDHVRMMVLNKQSGATVHSVFFQLDQYLKKGDLIILNGSRTVPAVLKGFWEQGNNSKEVEIRLAHRKSANIWEALVVEETLQIGATIRFTPSLTATITHAHPEAPFVTLDFNLCCSDLYNEIYQIGQPVRYEYIEQPWDLDYYQTVFATEPGSVEMPSAGRAFSWEMLFRLQKKGVNIAFIQLHTGLSYLLDDKWHLGPRENYEEYHVPEETVKAIDKAKQEGGRIIAVGTTVVRTLETVADEVGKLCSQTGWTNLYIHADTKLKVVDGLITGLHEPEASHLDLLTAFVDQKLLYNAYQEAINRKYLWHEFGDMNLIL